ncbi:Rhs element Vgr protein [Psychromonas ingrahamii 37]|uniref:Rhs element Vgr protein n=1 Tax=Psychromonas ingrahamii (strain DSM 17664 / CCUG 51855 / 37) TaxID=357804 RepID=A1SQY3_PSYIN|nr:type VI secretion system tip protein TssI/VgrG [Psychromonas ingrahamii]ABM01898.1 Rhs element Vgr protein [Psychromonas ingrahamii 37]
MSQYHFKFIYQENGSQNNELTLLKFSGQEGISQLFNFELELKSTDLNLDEDSLLNKSCSIEIYDGKQAKPIRIIHGLVNKFEDINYLPDCTLYRANIVPRIWQLGLFETNEVYLNETIERTLSAILEEAGFIEGQDFRFELNRTYRKWPFRLQYNETHLDYLQRIIEREGIYYYFEQNDNAEVIVFCDNNQALPSIVQPDQSKKIVFQANSAINVESKACTVTNIICKRQTLPKKVTLRDFNDETPSLDIRGEYIIDKTGMGEINLYGLNITSPEEGQQLAEIHANAYLSRQKSYIGEGDAATMVIGHTFKLAKHPRDKFNQLTYLLESIDHEGANLNQYQELDLNTDAVVNYSNSFTALSTEHPFAPKRQTLAPEINGTLNAVIDAEADSGYAELDEFGRYKVKLPFDRKDRNGGKASHWVRMMQPYGGANEGMHFPLRNGTRVLLGFIGGDPDRPFISGTINDNGEQKSIVTGENQTNNLIKTASGNKIELEDKEGKNRIKLQTGDNKTYMHLGSPNHPGDGFVVMSKGIERKEVTGGKQITRVTTNFATTAYLNDDNTLGSFHNSFDEDTSSVESEDLLDEQNYFLFPIKSLKGDGVAAADAVPEVPAKAARTSPDVAAEAAIPAVASTFTASSVLSLPADNLMTRNVELSGYYLIERTLGDKYTFEQGNEYEFNSPGDKRFQYGADREIIVCQDDASLGKSIKGEVYNKENHLKENQNKNRNLDAGSRLYRSLVELLTLKLTGYQSFTQSPLDGICKRFHKKLTPEEANDLLDNKCNFRVARHNTFNIQEGNIFDFGGYWNYDLGNSYAEVHGTQETEINKLYSKDIAKKAGPWWEKIEGKKLSFAQKDEEQVEKSYNNQYSYTKGKTIEVHKGDAESQHYGNSYDYHTGDSYEEVDGHSISHVRGSCHSTHHGATNEMFMGAKSEFLLGVSSSVVVAAVNDMFVGPKIEIQVAPGFYFSAGSKTEIESFKFKNVATEAANAAIDLQAAIATVDNDITILMNSINTIQSSVNTVVTKANEVDFTMIKLSSGAVNMLN